MPSKIYTLSQVLKQLRVFCFLVWLGVFTSLALAQLPTATILGVVKDSSGAVVPEAGLTARNTETGLTRTAVSAGDGSYRFSALPVGSYEVRVEQSGFQTAVRSGLTLTVAQEAVVNFTLEVGAVTQTVAVTAEAPLVNTTSGSLGGLVDEQRVAELPLNGRNYIDLTLLQAGVAEQKAVGGRGVGTSGFSGTYFSSNGATVRSNNYLLDGAILTNMWNVSSASITGSTLGVDGVREFRVVTNSFSAEYGMTMGSQMIIVSKGGTNNFHGDLFEYLRNSALDARNYFDYKSVASQRRLPPFTRNNFGAAFGGPIKQDKTFFHGVFEGVRERLGVTKINTVIPPSAKVDGGLVPQINPVIKPLLALYPDPNLPNSQYTWPYTQPATDNYGQTRVDHNFSDNDNLFARYTITDTTTEKLGTYPGFGSTLGTRAQFVTVSENHVFSPTLLNSFRASLSRTAMKAADYATEPIGALFSLMPTQRTGGISIGGISANGSNCCIPFDRRQNVWSYGDDLFYTRGRHSLKFGALLNRYQQFIWSSAGMKGASTFASLNTFLLGQATTISGNIPGSLPFRSWEFSTVGFYAQDDLRVRSNLTLNLGLRYEFNTVPQEQHGEWATLRDLARDAQPTVSAAYYGKNPSLRNFSPRFGFAWDVKGDAKTAVRGGFGLLYDLAQAYVGSSSVILSHGNYPHSVKFLQSSPPVFAIPLPVPPGVSDRTDTRNITMRMLDWELQQPHMLQYNLAVERGLPFDMALTVAYAGSRGLNIIRPKEGNYAFPQILPDGRPFWTGRESRLNPNWGTIEYHTADSNTWYNALQVGLLKRLSKGLQFQSSYTWSKVFDESSGNTNGEAAGIQDSHGIDPIHRKLDRGPAAFDITQVWKFNSIYRLPALTSAAGAAGKLLNGWAVSGILSLQSGQPFSPALNSNRSRSQVAGGGGGLDRPDLVPGRNGGNMIRGTSAGCLGFPAGTPIGTTARYYDPCAFTIPAAGFLGTAGRNILRTPGFANLDFSLVKDTALGFLGESGKLQFRAEFFNILNRANFGLPDRTVFAGTADVQAPLATAGRIVETVGTSRQIQLALKLLF